MKKILFLTVLSFLTAIYANSQTLQITGKVYDDSTSEGLANVSVVAADTKKGVSTDKDGNFSLTITGRSSVSLLISFVGYTPQTIKTSGATPLSVHLRKAPVNAADEVVVIGYQSVRRRDLTGSVSSVGAKQLRDIPLSSAAEALTGKLAGVQVTTTEGAPGADVIIRVRGGGSITQDNSPIYIVDGVQVENALSTISPQDIASVDVLKDASTTAIYGARGANGVVIITTKSGRAGRTQVSYNGSFGWRQIAKTIDVLKPYDFAVWQYERAKLTNDTSFTRVYGSTWDTLSVYKDIPFINWQDKVFGRKAPYSNHNVSVNGGSQNTTFNLSLTSNKEDGIQLESGFNRKLVNFRLDNRGDKFRVGFTSRYLDQIISGAGTTTSGTRTTNRLRHSIQYAPFEIPTLPSEDQFDEAYYQRSGNIINPVLATRAEYRKAYTKGVNLTGYFSYSLLKNLTFKSTAGFDNTNARQDAFFSKITGTARNFGNLPVATVGEQNSTTINNSNTLQYTLNSVAGKHDFDVLLGQEIYETRAKSSNIETRYFPADISPEKALANMSLGAPPAGSTLQQARPTTSETPASRIFSLFGRVGYSFDKKILANFTLRADRSSKFRYENGLLFFPSASLAYRFSQEDFIKNISFISDAKIRIGYGTAGNNRIGDLLYQQLYGVTGEYALNHSVVPGFAPSALANENLKWEKTISQNIGLDLSFLRNRLQFTMDVYYNKGNDLLLAVNIPPTSGYTSQLKNVGSTSNRGIEFQVNGTPVQTKDFSWNSNFNLSVNRNRVENLGGLNQITRNSGWQGSDGADDYLVKVGEPVGLMYGFVTDGWYKVDDFDYNATTATYTLKTGVPNSQLISGPIRPGSLKIRDINNDGQITVDGDRTVIGKAQPNFTGGWSNQFTYKSFDASIFMNFTVGGNIYNANNIEWTDGSFPNLNVSGVMTGRWKNLDEKGQLVTDPAALTALNTNTTIWTPNNSNRFYVKSSDVESGSFLRINNVTLGYTLPKSVISKIKIQSLRVYATVNNLSTLTRYSGYDPEVAARRADPLTPGVDFAAYPRARTWVFGLNVNF